jgi:hypothetical protein
MVMCRWTVPRSPGKVKCNAATLPISLDPGAPAFFPSRPMPLKMRAAKMETAMRTIGAVGLLAVCGLLAVAPARADTVPPFKGNDTGGIIAYALVSQSDIKAMAIDHCARYGKVVKFLAVQAYYGGYISFSCRWVPYGAMERPLHAAY